MKVVCAPDSFKGSIVAKEAAIALAAGVRGANPGAAIECCPIADGGEGTLETLAGTLSGFAGRLASAVVTGPRGAPTTARYAISVDGTIGIVELAEASGLHLLHADQRDPTKTTSFGTGELIALLAERGCQEIIVGLGGSATCDGGAGIAQALGGQFFDAQDRLIDTPLTGGALSTIRRHEPPPPLPRIRVACDVTNPLWGADGAAAVYGPQKGASTAQVSELDAALAHLAGIVGGDPHAPGAGAAGGAGFGLAALGGATLERGIDLVLDATGFEQRCHDAALVLTGEGCLDGQSLHGKATTGVARVAKRHGVPTIAIVGQFGPGAESCLESGGGMLHRAISLAERYGLDRAMTETAALLTEVAAELA